MLLVTALVAIEGFINTTLKQVLLNLGVRKPHRHTTASRKNPLLRKTSPLHHDLTQQKQVLNYQSPQHMHQASEPCCKHPSPVSKQVSIASPYLTCEASAQRLHLPGRPLTHGRRAPTASAAGQVLRPVAEPPSSTHISQPPYKLHPLRQASQARPQDRRAMRSASHAAPEGLVRPAKPVPGVPAAQVNARCAHPPTDLRLGITGAAAGTPRRAPRVKRCAERPWRPARPAP